MKKNYKKIVFLAFIFGVIVYSLLRFSSSQDAIASNTVKSNPVTFKMRLTGEPETLDWNLAHTMIESYLLMNLMEGLVTFDRELNVIPNLAEKWKVSDDGKTYTFYLKKDVLWSDGVPLTAQHFLYSWKRLLSPLTAASYAYFLFDVVGAKEFNSGELKDFKKVGIKTLDDHTFQVELKKPIAHWISIPSFWVTFPLRKDVVSKHGSAWPKPGRMVTVGPFTLSSYDIGSKIVLTENKNYHRKKGNIQKIVAQIVQDDSTALNLYEVGKLDFLTDISTIDLKRLQGREDLKSFSYLKTGYLGFSVNRYPITNVHLRKAIAMAIDKSKIGAILHGGQKPARSFIPPPLFSSSNTLGYSFDPKSAKRELSKAGWDSTTPLKLELLTSNWDKSLTLTQFIQGQLKQNLGLDVSIQPYDHKSFRAQLDLHVYSSFLLSWGADFPDPDNFLSVFLSRSGNNRTTWKNSDYDELVYKARALKDKKKREEAYISAQKILLNDDVVIVPLYYEPNMALVNKKVRGIFINPMNYLFLRDVYVGS